MVKAALPLRKDIKRSSKFLSSGRTTSTNAAEVPRPLPRYIAILVSTSRSTLQTHSVPAFSCWS
ncbi:MAG: hypothetical protein LZF60_160076 [Nitrospira sp.]|nr:MAG: hypothetical protein LZF60_160076 [Nitrospira sp.]